MGVLGFDEESHRMKVLSINPGHSREEIIENTGFELSWAEEIVETEPPTEEELTGWQDEQEWAD
jgi:acyl CoA:acetate/3-ketoacid CoA transferase beta subunit